MDDYRAIADGTYSYDYADDVKMWELVKYDAYTEEWACTGIYCENEFQASELGEILNKKKGEKYVE